MITHLFISNYTLIDELNIDFSDGFSVITGETGAGKSIILGAISLLLGSRGDTKLIKQGSKRCVIEAHFNLSQYDFGKFFSDNDIDFDADDTILRRELNQTGKSRAFINDTPVALSLMKEIGERLVDIHSQHQNLLLRKEDFQLNVVDTIANNQKMLADYRIAFSEYQSLLTDYEATKRAIDEAKRNADFLQFQLKELSEANLVADEQDSLEQETRMMEHAEDIKVALFEADSLLSSDDGVTENLRQIQRKIQSLESLLDSASSLAERLDSCYIEVKDIGDEVNALLEQVDFEPDKLARNQERLDLIYRLEKKYSVESVAQLIEIRNTIAQQVSNMSESDMVLEEISKKINFSLSECKKQARQISSSRKAVAKDIEKVIIAQLKALGMASVRFEIVFSEKSLSVDGMDKVNFLFSANKNTALCPIADVASGGEIARVMLSLKAMISGKVKLPTIIFDEIDTGVSGKAAEQMANIMANMGSQGRQVISITHLPQIAARGKSHYRVYKEETTDATTTRMTQLGREERIEEIAQMLSGSTITQAAIDNAKQLINNEN